jgi:diguanylate cyclase (GGDEF)-like protein
MSSYSVCRGTDGGRNVLLILVDLDHFRRSTSSRAQAGDAVLWHVAQVLSDAVRTVDLCARYGGKRLRVTPQTTERGAAGSRNDCGGAEMRAVLYEGEHIRVTASFGVSISRAEPAAIICAWGGQGALQGEGGG